MNTIMNSFSFMNPNPIYSRRHLLPTQGWVIPWSRPSNMDSGKLVFMSGAPRPEFSTLWALSPSSNHTWRD